MLSLLLLSQVGLHFKCCVKGLSALGKSSELGEITASEMHFFPLKPAGKEEKCSFFTLESAVALVTD